MTRKAIYVSSLMLAFLACLVTGVLATQAGEGHDHSKQKHGDHDQAHGGGDAMAEMMKNASPGEHHEHLARLVGKWKVATKFWMMPGQPPMESTGTATNEMIMGGRYLQSNFDGTFMGQPFKGMGIDGYDNASGKATGLWLDSMSTMMMNFSGECSGDKRTLVSNEFKDPMSGMMMKMKGVTTHKSDKEFTYEAWMLQDGAEPFKAMEITYTRM